MRPRPLQVASNQVPRRIWIRVFVTDFCIHAAKSLPGC